MKPFRTMRYVRLVWGGVFAGTFVGITGLGLDSWQFYVVMAMAVIGNILERTEL